MPTDLAAELDEIFHPKEPRLRSLPEIFNLDRRKLYTDTRLLLPFWQAVPFIGSLVAFLKRFFLGASEEERRARQERRLSRKRKVSRAVAEPAEATTVRYSPDNAAHDDADLAVATASPKTRRVEVARFKDAVQQLQKHYVRPGSTPERTLAELAERWNPLLDPVAQNNLVEDINSLARDFLRRMKVSFRLIPPTRERVNEWADRLCQNEAFHQIRRREDLKEYLKLYLLTILSK